jgi:hypothetical protein
MNSRKTKVNLELLTPIVTDGAIAGPLADGRLISLLILDCSAQPRVVELIRLHMNLPPGDHQFRWSTIERANYQVALELFFIRPIEVSIVIPFNIDERGILVESALAAGALYLRAGVPGDRMSTTMDSPTMIVELPDTGFAEVWGNLWLKHLTTSISKESGLPQKAPRTFARSQIQEMKDFVRIRVNPNN